MKQLLFKRIDLWLHIAVAIVPVILWKQQGLAIACSYIVVVQVLSAIVNMLFLKKRFIKGGRKLYQVCLAIITMICLVVWFARNEDLFFECIAVAMLFVLPMLVPVYFVVSFVELMNIRRAKKFDKIDHYKNKQP